MLVRLSSHSEHFVLICPLSLPYVRLMGFMKIGSEVESQIAFWILWVYFVIYNEVIIPAFRECSEDYMIIHVSKVLVIWGGQYLVAKMKQTNKQTSKILNTKGEIKLFLGDFVYFIIEILIIIFICLLMRFLQSPILLTSFQLFHVWKDQNHSF